MKAKKNSYCFCCGKNKKRVVPVGFVVGAKTIYNYFCIDCRLNLKSDKYVWLVQDMIHDKKGMLAFKEINE
jgi:hypothetical protein